LISGSSIATTATNTFKIARAFRAVPRNRKGWHGRCIRGVPRREDNGDFNSHSQERCGFYSNFFSSVIFISGKYLSRFSMYTAV
jgi:hypothetical protein